MNCPYCNKRIEGITGFQEVSKFQKHLNVCKKNPNVKPIHVSAAGEVFLPQHTLKEALEIRANSGQ